MTRGANHFPSGFCHVENRDAFSTEAHRKVGAPQVQSFPAYTTRRTGLKRFGDSKKRLPAFISMRALFLRQPAFISMRALFEKAFKNRKKPAL